jgi:hypothetical protein
MYIVGYIQVFFFEFLKLWNLNFFGCSKKVLQGARVPKRRTRVMSSFHKIKTQWQNRIQKEKKKTSELKLASHSRKKKHHTTHFIMKHPNKRMSCSRMQSVNTWQRICSGVTKPTSNTETVPQLQQTHMNFYMYLSRSSSFCSTAWKAKTNIETPSFTNCSNH